MKAYLLAMLVLLSLAGVLPMHVSAHVLATDGATGAVLHIDPEDEPEAGATSTIHLTFRGRDAAFAFGSCNCVVSIEKEHTVLYSQTLSALNFSPAAETAFSFVFPEIGIYDLTVTGSTGGMVSATDTDSFKLSFDIRVGREAKLASGTPVSFFATHGLHAALAVFLAALIGAALLWQTFQS
jgi:hypothetical protein